MRKIRNMRNMQMLFSPRKTQSTFALFSFFICCVFSFVVSQSHSNLWAQAPVAKSPDARRVAVVIDQPVGLVMGPESEILSDIVMRLDKTTADLALTVVNPTQDGTLVRRSDKKQMSMNDFDVLWLYREYNMNDDQITIVPSFVEKLKAFASQKGKGIVLTGHTCPLFEQLGFGKLTMKLHTNQTDRQQVGIVPYRPDASLFAGTISDRNMISMSHATYHAYEIFKTPAKNVVSYATTNEPWFIPLYAGLVDNANGTKQTSVLVFPWLINYVYDETENEFRHNYETLSLNLLRQAGRTFRPEDIVEPAFVLPDFAALKRALNDLIETWDEDYPKGKEYLKTLAALETRAKSVTTAQQAEALQKDFLELQRTALLANPELDFNEILFIRRNPKNLGFPANYNSNSSLKPTGYSNELARFNFRTGKTSLVFKPSQDEFVGDIDLYYDANKFLFSMPDAKQEFRSRLWELEIDPANPDKTFAPKKVSTIEEIDVDNYDACYLPDDRIIFCSTACFTGVPCTNGAGHICNLYQRKTDGSVR
ncbi:MAG: hypothetical protein Q4G59_01750, partial [Planctomycetia bacterium]|nr:hypothetical protein [Planctomycetia bacterium]